MSFPSSNSFGWSDDAKCSYHITSSPPSSTTKPLHDHMHYDDHVRPSSPMYATEIMHALAYLRSIRPRVSLTSSIQAPNAQSEQPLSTSSSLILGIPAPVDAPTRRVLKWRQDINDKPDSDSISIGKRPWTSFLPSLRSMRSSASPSSSYQSLETMPRVAVRVEPSAPPPQIYGTHLPSPEDYETQSLSECTDELYSWPYDGRGLYEHHEKYDCGLACFVACQNRRQFKPRKKRVLGSLARLLGRQVGGEEVMANSDVPHPPWWIGYRSNDDSLSEDEDDGDLELWLEHKTQKQAMDHELRFCLFLSPRPDSRIFEF